MSYNIETACVDLGPVFKPLFCEHNLQASVRNEVSTAEASVLKLGAHKLLCPFDSVQYALRHALKYKLAEVT